MPKQKNVHSPAFMILAVVIVSLAGYLLFFSGSPAPTMPVVTPEMTFCQADSDCKIITTPNCCSCPMIALNNSVASKQFEFQKQTYCSYVSERDGGIVCLAIYCGEPTNAAAQCVSNKCIAIANDLRN